MIKEVSAEQYWRSFLEAVSPMTLHLAGLAFIYLTTLVVKIKTGLLRKVVALVLFNAILAVGFFKTSGDQNLFRVLRTARNPPIADIQVGLDRLEMTMDEETVAEMEEKLTGKTSSYFLKGHDLFGDEYPMLDFNEKLSVAKQAKQYRLIADHLIFFYSTFMLVPASTPKKARLLLIFAIGAGLFCQMLLYEVLPDLENWTAELRQLIFTQTAFRDFAVFNVASLIQFTVSALLLSFLLAWRLGAVDEQSLACRITSLANSKGKVDWQKETKALASEYKDFSEGVVQNEKLSKYINLTMVGGVVMTLAIFAVDFWEQSQPKTE